MSTFAVMLVPARAFLAVKAEIAKLPQSDYGHMIDRATFSHPERLKFDAVALQAYPSARLDPDPDEDRRAELAAILEIVAKDGLDGPRDLDVALDAILSVFGEEHGG